MLVEEAELFIPANRHAPIAARLRFSGPAHSANFNWREQGSEAWTIAIDTGSGKRITLFGDGARLGVDEAEQLLARMGEYPSIYSRFAELVGRRQVESDQQPLCIVAGASLIARRMAVEPFV